MIGTIIMIGDRNINIIEEFLNTWIIWIKKKQFKYVGLTIKVPKPIFFMQNIHVNDESLLYLRRMQKCLTQFSSFFFFARKLAITPQLYFPVEQLSLLVQ